MTRRAKWHFALLVGALGVTAQGCDLPVGEGGRRP